MMPKPRIAPRLGGGVRMTLIATFPARNGIVVCADTQETCPYQDAQGNVYELRRAVQKLAPEQIGDYSLAIAGAGHAQLIDAFIVRVRRAILASTAQPSASALRSLLEDRLDAFYRNDVMICPDVGKDFKLFIPFFCPATREYGLWVSEQSVLRDVNGPEIIGWEHEMYAGMKSRLYKPDMSIAQAVLACLYILTVGEETSNYIRGPFHIAVVRENGIWMEPPDYIAMMSDRLRSFESGINRLFLACADTAISPEHFEEVLTTFGEQASSLHKQHLDAVVQRLVAGGLIMNLPYPPIPPGTMIRLHADGSFDADYDIDAKRKLAAIVRAQHGTVPPPLEDAK